MKRSLYSVLAVLVVTFAAFYGRDTSHVNAWGHATYTLRGVPGDLSADVVLGQRNFEEVDPGTVSGGEVFTAHGVIVDRVNSKFYVYDSGHNRVLGYELSCAFTTPVTCNSPKVMGQPDAVSSACNGDSGYQNYPKRAPASSDSLCGMLESQLSLEEGGSASSMDIDGAGNLYVTDFWNHRVLKYNYPFGASETAAADDVWGQADMTGNLCNRGGAATTSSLCFIQGFTNNLKAGVDYDDDLGNLYVADSGNDRIVRYPTGQKTGNLTWYVPDPSAVRIRPNYGWLYVTSTANRTVTLYKTPPTPTKTLTFGTPQNPTAPTGVDLDPLGRGIWITHTGNKTIELWDYELLNAAPIQTLTLTNQMSAVSSSIGLTTNADVLVTTGTRDGSDSNRVFLYKRHLDGTYDTTPTAVTTIAPRTLSDLVGAVAGAVWWKNPNTSGSPQTQLIVADRGRILWWDNPNPDTMTNGQAASGCVSTGGGVCTLATSVGGCCNALAASTNNLWASAIPSGNQPHRVLVYSLPLSTANSYPQWTFSLPLPVINTVPTEFIGTGPELIGGIAPAANDSYVWLTLTDSSRAVRLLNPLGGGPRYVDVVLGQPSATSTACNHNNGNPGFPVDPASLCNPGGVAIDKLGNLWISDHWLEIRGNVRLLEYDAASFPVVGSGSGPVYGVVESKKMPTAATLQPIFDSENRLVAGYNPYCYPDIAQCLAKTNPGPVATTPPQLDPSVDPDPGREGWFPGVYNNPLDPNKTEQQRRIPDSFIRDYFSEAIGGSFDDQGNLYLADLNRGRVLVYKQPFKLTLGIQDPDVDNDGRVLVTDILKINAAYAKKAAIEWAGWYRYEGVEFPGVQYDRVDLARDSANAITVADINIVTGDYALNWPPNNVSVGRAITFYLKGAGPVGRSVTYSMTSSPPLPPGACLNCGSQGRFAWTPQAGQSGTYNITFQVTDGVQTASVPLTITVL